VSKNKTSHIHQLNKQSTSSLKLQVSPNPNNGNFIVKFHLTQLSQVKITLYNTEGKKIEEKLLNETVLGENTFHRKFKNLDKGGTYLLTIETENEKITQKISIEP
jgi:hypothetical protein